MNDFEAVFRQLDAAGASADPGVSGLLLSMLLAFVMGQFIAWVYAWTHAGVSYARSFSQSLVILMVIATLVMSVIGNNVVAAFGLIGALAIIRFRNVLKDTRDTAFIFLTLVLGMALGSQRYAIAIVGGAFLMLVAGWLHLTRFGARGRFDGHLSYRTEGVRSALADLLDPVIGRYCRSVKPVTVHDAGENIEYVYQVRLRDRNRGHDLVSDMRSLRGVVDVVLVLRDEHTEI